MAPSPPRGGETALLGSISKGEGLDAEAGDDLSHIAPLATTLTGPQSDPRLSQRRRQTTLNSG